MGRDDLAFGNAVSHVAATGDAILLNDPLLGSGHLPDFFITQPVFEAETIVGFVVNIKGRPSHAVVAQGLRYVEPCGGGHIPKVHYDPQRLAGFGGRVL